MLFTRSKMHINKCDSLGVWELYLHCERYKAAKTKDDRASLLDKIKKTFMDKEGKYETEARDIFEKLGHLMVEKIVASTDGDPNVVDAIARECRAVLEKDYL